MDPLVTSLAQAVLGAAPDWLAQVLAADPAAAVLAEGRFGTALGDRPRLAVMTRAPAPPLPCPPPAGALLTLEGDAAGVARWFAQADGGAMSAWDRAADGLLTLRPAAPDDPAAEARRALAPALPPERWAALVADGRVLGLGAQGPRPVDGRPDADLLGPHARTAADLVARGLHARSVALEVDPAGAPRVTVWWSWSPHGPGEVPAALGAAGAGLDALTEAVIPWLPAGDRPVARAFLSRAAGGWLEAGRRARPELAAAWYEPFAAAAARVSPAERLPLLAARAGAPPPAPAAATPAPAAVAGGVEAATRQAAAHLGLPADGASRLGAYVEHLFRWDAATGRLGRPALDDFLGADVLPSLALVRHLPDGARSVVDVGTGLGFPGVVVAALRPDLDVLLCDDQPWRTAFLSEALAGLGLPRARVRCARSTDLGERFDVVTARHLGATLGLTLQATLPVLAPGGTLLVMRHEPPPDGLADEARAHGATLADVGEVTLPGARPTWVLTLRAG